MPKNLPEHGFEVHDFMFPMKPHVTSERWGACRFPREMSSIFTYQERDYYNDNMITTSPFTYKWRYNRHTSQIIRMSDWLKHARVQYTNREKGEVELEMKESEWWAMFVYTVTRAQSTFITNNSLSDKLKQARVQYTNREKGEEELERKEYEWWAMFVYTVTRAQSTFLTNSSMSD